jgi:hypothetical protein
MARFRKTREDVVMWPVQEVVVVVRRGKLKESSHRAPRLSVSDCLFRSCYIHHLADATHQNNIIYSSLKVALPEVVKRRVLSIQLTEGVPEDDSPNP